MSELKHALELFGFVSIDDLSTDSLKKAFKTHILQVHPDKGGNSEIFDKMLKAYMYLTEIGQRISGGRTALHDIISPDELKEMRSDEIINRFFEFFDNDHFNQQFEEKNKKELHGYSTWLKNTDGENLVYGTYGYATQKPPPFKDSDLNIFFELTVKEGKPEPSAIILHPEAMGYVSGQTLGTDIIENVESGYTSNIFTNPEFTDVFEAFTGENTIYDKLPKYVEQNKSIDELVVERNKEITPFTDSELQAIQEFEKKKIETNFNNISKIKDYYEFDTTYQSNLINCPSEKYSNKNYSGFVINFINEQ